MFRRAPDLSRTSASEVLLRFAAVTGLLVATTALGVALPTSQAQAQSCAAGGALIPFLNPATNLTRGQEVTILPEIQNGSSTNPPPGVDVPARLAAVPGDTDPTVVIRIGCIDTACTNFVNGILEPRFNNDDSCTFDPTEVASCVFVPGQLGQPDTVEIFMTEDGVDLAPDGEDNFVQFLATAAEPIQDPNGFFRVLAQTSQGALMTTAPMEQCNPQVTGEAGGSVTATFPPVPIVSISKVCTDCDQSGNPPSFTSMSTVTITNTGLDPALDCTVRDVFDPGGPDETVLFELDIPEFEAMSEMVLPPVETPSHLADVTNQATIECTPVPISTEAVTSASTEDVCECDPMPPVVEIEKVCGDCSPETLQSEFTVTVRNVGPTAATNCVVEDDFAGLSIPIGTLNSGQEMDFSDLTPPHADPVLNTASITCDSFAEIPVMAETSDLCECTVEPFIEITKLCETCDRDTFESEVTLTVTNSGTYQATNCVVTDFNPALGLNIDQNIGTVLPGGSFEIMEMTTEFGPAPVSNTATVTCDPFPAPPSTPRGQSTDSSTDSCECPFEPDVMIDKVCGVCNPVTRISPVTVTVSNDGTGGAMTCQVTDVVEGQTILDQTIDLPFGGPPQIFNVDTQALIGENSINTATVECAFPDGRGMTMDSATDPCMCEILRPEITIEKRCEDCEPQTPTSGPYTSMVTVTINNTGNAPATNCQVVDTFNGQVIFQETLASVPVGSQDLMFNTPGFDSTTQNLVTIECDEVPDAMTSDSATAECVCELPMVRIDKICTPCDPNSVPPNQSDVSVTVFNDGDGAATNCQVIDNFPGSPGLIDENIPVFNGMTQQVFNATTPPFANTELNEAEIVCDFMPAPAVTSADTSDPCECSPPPFVPPCSGVECEICFPDDLKGDKINPF